MCPVPGARRDRVPHGDRQFGEQCGRRVDRTLDAELRHGDEIERGARIHGNPFGREPEISRDLAQACIGQLDPDDAAAYNNRGISYDNLGQYQRAIEDYDKSIQLDPDDADNYINRGSAYSQLGQHQNSINDYTKAIQIGGSNDAVAYNNRSNRYLALGQSTLADADKTMACSLDSKYC